MGASWREAGLRIYRAGVFSGVVLMMHRAAPPADQAHDFAGSLEDLQAFFSAAVEASHSVDGRGEHRVRDAAGKVLGFVVTTAPGTDDIVGFSGPNDVLLAFGADGKVLGMSIRHSGDTPEHVAQVRADAGFMATFDGMGWDQVAALERVDGVSGATLTSLAIVEGVLRRVAGGAPSLRFPKRAGLAEARQVFPRADGMDENGAVFGENGVLLGQLRSSAPHGDNLIGYNGPTEVLMGTDGGTGEVVGMAIGDTYDTGHYVDYVRDERGFMAMFDGMTLEEIAKFDLEENGVEGVSGATMTSLAVAGAAVELARADAESRQDDGRFAAGGITSRAVGTVLVLAIGLLMAFTRLRGVRPLRVAFQLVLIGYLGMMNGDVLSQALLVGWANHGVAWRLAPGLLLMVAAALLVPLATRRQVYCHQICPHGAAQQLLKNALPTKWRVAVPRRLATALRAIPFFLLLLVIVVGVRQLAFGLVSIEPFHAYLFRSAAWATLAIAAVGLVASLFIPMAYCRYGCPTGAVLNFLGGGGSLSRRDALALACLALAVALRAGG